MKLFEKILYDSLTESSLSRLRQLVKSDKSFAVVSPYHNSRDTSKNEQYLVELKDYLKSKKYSYIPVQGTYTYDQGDNSVEQSLIILDIDFDDALMLGAAYNQESIIYHNADVFGMYYTSFKYTEGDDPEIDFSARNIGSVQGEFPLRDILVDYNSEYTSTIKKGNKNSQKPFLYV